MILLVHKNNKPVAIYYANSGDAIDFDTQKSISSVLFELAKSHPEELLIWVHQDYKNHINVDALKHIFHHKLIMASYSVSGRYIIPPQIGYIEQKPYTNVSPSVTYPTWLMSSDIGGIYAEALQKIKWEQTEGKNFDFLLCSLAKQAMPKGLFCYSNPNLLKNIVEVKAQNIEVSIFQLLKFVKQHYKTIWVFNMLFCFLFFEKKLHLLAFFKSLFFKRLHTEIDFSNIQVKSNIKENINEEVDVIIPTLARKACLYDVLKDLSKQTILPKNVIIVEQNPIENSVSELDYLTNQTWPFTIKHHFIHQAGACNARNMALSKVTSEWVLLGDDDNRFDSDLIEKFFIRIKDFHCRVLTTVYLQPHETPEYFFASQTDIFGSGNTLMKSSLLEKVKFETAFEFGYGEDSDFGMQLRKTGNDVIFFPDIKITHLKAPIGGFRTKVKQLWEDDEMQPKPSPTIMLFNKKHYNVFQIKGYKYTLFVKLYKKQKIRNPLKYINFMESKWERSEYWTNELMIND